MEILFVGPEITPYGRTGSIGDVCAALPKALRGLGHRVTVVSPLSRDVDPAAHSFARRLSPCAVELDGAPTECTLFDGRTTGGVDLVFVGHDSLATPALAEGDPAARVRAAALFGAAVVPIARSREPAIEILHAHGWFGATALAFAEKSLPEVGRVLSLHDANDRAPLDDPRVALGPHLREALGAGARPSLLAAGTRAAQRVIAGSQSEASDLAKDGAGAALGPALLAGGRLVGIADGLDDARWNPITDSYLPARFDPVNLEGKARCKDQLQLDCGLPVRSGTPLLAALIDSEAAAALVASAAAQALRNDLQLVVLGAAGGAACAALSERYPDRVTLASGTDEKLLHRAIAASDFVLLPAPPRRETGVLLAALRYGTLPIALRAGATADVLVDCDARLETGTGFAIERADATQVAEAIGHALAAYAQRERFVALRRKVMRLDLSWERSARRYEYVYKGLRERRD